MADDPETRGRPARSGPPVLAFPPLLPARFIRRVNRFVAEVELVEATPGSAPGGPPALPSGIVVVHVPTTGRMRELLVEDALVYVAAAAGSGRRTHLDLLLAESSAGLVCVDARVPNRLLARHWRVAPSPAGLAVAALSPEPRHSRGRFDFRLLDEAGPMLVEVKSVTLVRHGAALFPDAPTARGARHLDDLSQWVKEGGRAAAVFVVQRADGEWVAPNHATDPAFAEALRRATAAGVIVVAYRAAVTLEATWISGELPLRVGD